ncbi:hypothetical protein DSL72_004725 [Monilinia vaccinii-corymbosi]|uniref:Uncharacterized protein n=1 Tax=Monilinia vaccinii-corymbosi TaxID=61207 RepID=A0A8A3NX13_9HELO|nr:hypothetical protein DSL72_004725 [Monilinia vaccinii-corymbosi]
MTTHADRKPCASLNSPVDDVMETLQNLSDEREWAQFTISPQEYKTIRVLLTKYTNREEEGEEEGDKQALEKKNKKKENQLNSIHDTTAESFQELSVKAIRDVISNCPDTFPFKQKLYHGIRGRTNNAVDVWNCGKGIRKPSKEKNIGIFVHANTKKGSKVKIQQWRFVVWMVMKKLKSTNQSNSN